MEKSPLLSSVRPDWETPQKLFDFFNRRYHFYMDAAASVANAKCPVFYSISDGVGVGDGLKSPWQRAVWCNPPYGRGVGVWVDKAISEVSAGNCSRAVLLLPARTDTQWFKKVMNRASVIWFLEGRLTFAGAPAPAPFPSIVVCFDGAPLQVLWLPKSEWNGESNAS